jgi:hypothetical protein
MEATLELNKTTKTDLLKIDPRSIIFDPKDNPRVGCAKYLKKDCSSGRNSESVRPIVSAETIIYIIFIRG